MLTLLILIVPLGAAISMPFLIPFLAWKGRPRGFKRLQWVGVAVGSGIIGLIALGFCTYVGEKPFDHQGSSMDVVYTVLQLCTAIFLSAAFSSFIALFFCRPTESPK